MPGVLHARQVRQAIDARSAQRLLVAGERIDQACEACHVRYWYPDAEKPGWPAPLRKE